MSSAISLKMIAACQSLAVGNKELNEHIAITELTKYASANGIEFRTMTCFEKVSSKMVPTCLTRKFVRLSCAATQIYTPA